MYGPAIWTCRGYKQKFRIFLGCCWRGLQQRRWQTSIEISLGPFDTTPEISLAAAKAAATKKSRIFHRGKFGITFTLSADLKSV